MGRANSESLGGWVYKCKLLTNLGCLLVILEQESAHFFLKGPGEYLKCFRPHGPCGPFTTLNTAIPV